MSKLKSAFFCQSCGYEAPKWLGKCPGCSNWNTFVEEIKQKKGSTAPFSKNSTDAKPVALQEYRRKYTAEEGITRQGAKSCARRRCCSWFINSCRW